MTSSSPFTLRKPQRHYTYTVLMERLSQQSSSLRHTWHRFSKSQGQARPTSSSSTASFRVRGA